MVALVFGPWSLHMENWEEVSGFCLQPDLESAVAAIWEMDQQLEGLFLPLCLPL